MQRPSMVTIALVALLATAAPGFSAPAGAPSGWTDQIQRRLQQQEYELTWQNQPVIHDLPAAWHAPNRAHGLRSYFTRDGIHVVPRTQESPSWVWSLSLVGYGRGTTLWPVDEARLSASGNRMATPSLVPMKISPVPSVI